MCEVEEAFGHFETVSKRFVTWGCWKQEANLTLNLRCRNELAYLYVPIEFQSTCFREKAAWAICVVGESLPHNPA